MDAFLESKKQAEEDLKNIECQKHKVRILSDLNQGLPGTE